MANIQIVKLTTGEDLIGDLEELDPGSFSASIANVPVADNAGDTFGDGNMDLSVVDVTRVATEGISSLIGCQAVPVSSVDRCELVDRRDRSKGTGGGRGSDREGQHRKRIMGVGPIGELDAVGGDESRTLFPLRPKAATASNPRGYRQVRALG